MNDQPIEQDAARLDEWLRNGGAIDFLTVHGVGVADDTLVVYCRAKRHAEKRIPKSFGGHRVTYVLCKVMPGRAVSR